MIEDSYTRDLNDLVKSVIQICYSDFVRSRSISRPVDHFKTVLPVAGTNPRIIKRSNDLTV